VDGKVLFRQLEIKYEFSLDCWPWRRWSLKVIGSPGRVLQQSGPASSGLGTAMLALDRGPRVVATDELRFATQVHPDARAAGGFFGCLGG